MAILDILGVDEPKKKKKKKKSSGSNLDKQLELAIVFVVGSDRFNAELEKFAKDGGPVSKVVDEFKSAAKDDPGFKSAVIACLKNKGSPPTCNRVVIAGVALLRTILQSEQFNKLSPVSQYSVATKHQEESEALAKRVEQLSDSEEEDDDVDVDEEVESEDPVIAGLADEVRDAANSSLEDIQRGENKSSRVQKQVLEEANSVFDALVGVDSGDEDQSFLSMIFSSEE